MIVDDYIIITQTTAFILFHYSICLNKWRWSLAWQQNCTPVIHVKSAVQEFDKYFRFQNFLWYIVCFMCCISGWHKLIAAACLHSCMQELQFWWKVTLVGWLPCECDFRTLYASCVYTLEQSATLSLYLLGCIILVYELSKRLRWCLVLHKM